MGINLEIITPFGIKWKGEAEYINFRSTDGDIGFLPERAPAIMELQIAVASIKTKEKTEKFLVHGGFIFNTREKTSIVSPAVEEASSINIARSQARIKKIEDTLTLEKDIREAERLKNKLERHLMRVKVGEENEKEG